MSGAAPFFVGVGVGVTHNLGALGTFPVAVDAGFRPPISGRPLSFALEARYASGSGDASVAGETVAFSTHHLVFEALGSWRLDLGRFEPFAEMGGGVAFTGAEVTPTVGAVDRRSHTEPSFELGGGVELSLGPGRIRLALRYGYLPLSPPLSGDATGLVLLAGYRFDL